MLCALSHHSQEISCGCVIKRIKSDVCPGACQVCSGAGGAEEPPQKEAGKRLIPVLSCEGRLGSTPAVGAASPAPVGLREMSF